MSAEPPTGTGQVPMIRKSLQVSRPWLIGAEARMTVFSPGLVGQPSLRAMAPPVLVMTRFWGARSGNWGWGGGASTWSWPNWARVQLILANNWKPLRVPFWPRRVVLLASLAAAIQAARWASWSERQRAATRPRMVRTPIWEGVRGLEGMARTRLIWPNWPACETFRPRLPDWGMSNIFIR